MTGGGPSSQGRCTRDVICDAGAGAAAGIPFSSDFLFMFDRVWVKLMVGSLKINRLLLFS